jgi:hypothetical protein
VNIESTVDEFEAMDAFVASLDKDQRAAVVRWVFKSVMNNVREGGSANTLVHERLGVNREFYDVFRSDAAFLSRVRVDGII